MGRSSAEILLVEDNPADVLLTETQFAEFQSSPRLHAVEDGEAALRFLRQEYEYAKAPRPALVMLDLNLPGLSGHEVLRRMKSDEDLCTIPVVILSSSNARKDIEAAYREHASAYITKPTSLGDFSRVAASIESFWLDVAELPA